MKKGDFKYYIDNFGYRNDEGRRQAALKDVDEAVEKAELFRPYAEGFDFVGDGYFEKAVHLRRFLLRSGLAKERDLAGCTTAGELALAYSGLFLRSSG